MSKTWLVFCLTDLQKHKTISFETKKHEENIITCELTVSKVAGVKFEFSFFKY